MSSCLKKIFSVVFLIQVHLAIASGGYDNGTPAGKGDLDIELTLNPGGYIEYGQSYIVWGYGLTDRIDFHGYASHANDFNQLYTGILYNFIGNKYIDLSTAMGVRFIKGTIDAFFPQLLYTIKLPRNFDIIGSVVHLFYTEEKFKQNDSFRIDSRDYKAGLTFDIALRIPIPIKKIQPDFVKGVKFAIGAFRGVTGNLYPTYSVDFRFDIFRHDKESKSTEE